MKLLKLLAPLAVILLIGACTNKYTTIPHLSSGIVITDIENPDLLTVLDPNINKIKQKITIPDIREIAVAKKTVIGTLLNKNEMSDTFSYILVNDSRIIEKSIEGETSFVSHPALDKAYLINNSSNIVGQLKLNNNEVNNIVDKQKILAIGEMKGTVILAVKRQENNKTVFTLKDADNYKSLTKIKTIENILEVFFGKNNLLAVSKKSLFLFKATDFKTYKRFSFKGVTFSESSSVVQHGDNVFITDINGQIQKIKTSVGIVKNRSQENGYKLINFYQKFLYGYQDTAKQAYLVKIDSSSLKILQKTPINNIPNEQILVKNKIFFVNSLGDMPNNRIFIYNMQNNKLISKIIGKTLYDIDYLPKQ